MTKSEKQNYLNKKTIGGWAVWGVWGGVEVKDIEYGINDYAIIVVNETSVHRVKIYYGKRPNIRIYGRRLYFDKCLRIN